MNQRYLKTAAGAAIAAGLAAAAPGAAHAQTPAGLLEGADGRCLALASADLADTEVTATEVVEEPDLPAFCEVTAAIRPVEGSEIGVVYRLPLEWNGKVLGLGGGGWMGNVTLVAAREGLSRGYATLQTDGGHASGTAFDASPWAIREDGSLDRTKMEDFSYRAIHLMTERGKDVAEAFYGRPHQHAIYQGCSTGGRMGLMETQRFPGDFDGVIAGAPVYTLQVQTSAVLRTNAFAAPGARLAPAHLELVNDAVLAACDAADGAEDGILRDPRTCGFDPHDLVCEGAPGDSCLTEAQADGLARVYAGETMASGEVASYPLEVGSEMNWEGLLATGERMRFVPATGEGDPGGNTGGLYSFRGPLLGDPDYDFSDFTAEDVAAVRDSWMAEVYEADDADISEFVDGGGKLILWHGINDPGPSPRATVAYYEDALAETPGAADAMRLFLAPGVGHCRGGVGPDTVDWLGAMEAWVEDGEAPEQVLATKIDSDREWNLCAYPELPTGQGDGTYTCE